MSGLPSKQDWLSHAEAAELLGVSVRTVERWTKSKTKCSALGAVRCGNRWRIPRPTNLDRWVSDSRRQLKKLDSRLNKAWEHELIKIGKENSRHYLESHRLWIAASLMALEHRDLTEQARYSAVLLCQVAGEILAPLPRHQMDVRILKREFPARLRARVLSESQVDSVMSYWPGEEQFRQVKTALTLKELESIRRRLDYAQAICKLEQNGQKPTAQLVRPLLHKDLTTHINDTGEQLPAGIMDMRQPQDGLPLRTAQRRHPTKQSPQRDIVQAAYGVRDSIPGADG